MADTLHTIHSLVRYAVLLAAMGAGIMAALAWRRAAGTGDGDRKALAVFVGVLDVQVLLGIVLLVVWPYYPMLIGHIVMMVLAAAVAHGGSVLARRRAPARAAGVRLWTVVVALVLIVGGIMAIQRPIL